MEEEGMEIIKKGRGLSGVRARGELNRRPN